MKTGRWLVVLVVALLSGGTRAAELNAASEAQLLEDDLVATGKVVRLVTRPGQPDFTQPTTLAMVEVDRVLKGPPLQPGSTVAVAELLGSSHAPFEGEAGIWRLHRDPDRNFYWDSLSGARAVQHLPEYRAALARLDKLSWGQAANGMQAVLAFAAPAARGGGAATQPSAAGLAATGAVEGEAARRAALTTAAGQGGAEVREILATHPRPLSGTLRFTFLLSRTADSVARYAYYQPDRPVRLEIVGPAGKLPDVDLYAAIMAKVPAWPALAERDFRLLGTGQVRALGPGGAVLGAHWFTLELQQPGTYTITAVYANRRDGKEFGLKDVWTGEVRSNPVTVEYQAK